MTTQSLNHTFGHPIADLSNRLAERIRQRRVRKGIRRMLDLDDQILDDIGVTRWEVLSASQLPLSVDAATELRRISLERRRSKM